MRCCFHLSVQKFKEYLNGSNLIIKLQAKHDLLKQTLGEGEVPFLFICLISSCHYDQQNPHSVTGWRSYLMSSGE